jgi:hypothetical protein
MHSASISAAHLWGAAGSIILLRPRTAPWQLSDCFKTFFPPSHELLEEVEKITLQLLKDDGICRDANQEWLRRRLKCFAKRCSTSTS